MEHTWERFRLATVRVADCKIGTGCDIAHEQDYSDLQSACGAATAMLAVLDSVYGCSTHRVDVWLVGRKTDKPVCSIRE